MESSVDFDTFLAEKLNEYGYSLQQIFTELAFGDDANAKDIVEEIATEWINLDTDSD